MTQDMIKYNIFFDESEVKSLRVNMDISLMGCLRIPESLYNTPKIQSLTAKLRNGSLKLHFAEYKQSHLKKISTQLFLRAYLVEYSPQLPLMPTRPLIPIPNPRSLKGTSYPAFAWKKKK